MSTHTILIMAGGTGGHVFPGLAVADYLRQTGWHVVWLGTEAGMELKLVPQHGYETEVISFSGLRGKRLAAWLMLPLRLLKAFWQSARIIQRVKPDVVLGMGGYPAFPGGIQSTHHTASAGARNQAGRKLVRLKCFENAHVREPTCAPTAQRNAQAGHAHRRRCHRWRNRRRCAGAGRQA